MPLSPTTIVDEQWMRRAITLARRGQGSVEPNPMVGCVIVKDGACIAEGFHRKFGQAHAEVDALQSLLDPQDAKGATAYVTLEPCCHTGKTPPCTEALIAAEISRVVVAMKDPFPKVDGGGLRRLEQVGIQVEVGVLQSFAEDLNAPYLKRLTSGCPWVIAKWAMSIDGKIATTTGTVNGSAMRFLVAKCIGCAVVSMQSSWGEARPLPMIRRSRLVLRDNGLQFVLSWLENRLPSLQSKLMKTVDVSPLLIAASNEADSAQLDELQKAGAEILLLPDASRADQVTALLNELGKRQFTNVMVEGGAELLASFSAADQLDEIQAYICPKLIGGKKGSWAARW